MDSRTRAKIVVWHYPPYQCMCGTESEWKSLPLAKSTKIGEQCFATCERQEDTAKIEPALRLVANEPVTSKERREGFEDTCIVFDQVLQSSDHVFDNIGRSGVIAYVDAEDGEEQKPYNNDGCENAR